MLNELEQIYVKLIEFLQRDDLSYLERENLQTAKTAIFLIIKMRGV